MVIRKKDLKAPRRARVEALPPEPVEESRLHRVRRRSSAKRVFGLTILVIVLLVGGWFATKVALGGWSWDGSIKSLFSFNTTKLIGEESGRVNVILLGIPGGGPEVEGPNLTDTVMVASLSTTDKSGLLFSLPRDLFVKVPEFGDSKLNAVYEIGNAQEGGEGGKLAADVVGQALGLEIPYYIRIDFSGFAKLIDELGGINVTVDKDLYDDKYPGPNKTYEVVDIKAGTYTMDGAMALKYARSRQSTSDFDRARRQQQVMLAMREKAMESSLLTNPTKALAVLDLLTDSIQTNLAIPEMKRALELTKDFDATKLVTKVFDDTAAGLLYGTRVGEQYALMPVGDDYKVISDYVAKVISGETTVEDADKEVAATAEPLKVEVLNGTTTTGLAGKIAATLKTQGYNVVSTGNNATKGFTKTMVYDMSGGKREWDVKRLASSLKAEIGTDEVTTTTGAEVRVVLGTEASSL